MKKKLIIIILVMIIIGYTMAQTREKPFRVGASLGYTFSGYREETYSPINRYLNTLTFLVDGNIEKDKFFHSLNIGFFVGNSEMKNPAKAVLAQDYDPQKGEPYYWAYLPRHLAIRGYLEYALDYRLWGNLTFPGFLGGAFRADTYLQFAHYPSITVLASLDIHATQKWIINEENVFIFSAGLPFFGYAVRPAYAGADEALIKYSSESPMKIITLGRVVSLHNYWAFFGDLKYQHKVTTLINLYTGLGFEISRINFPRPRIDALLRLSGGVAFTF
ncbi:MAG: hypothetical protein LBC60_00035 [Spirochaetaceae bacterium]|jgi:hypothetical protein|nr:hypothetical protein [Spirochaetaceae bacterium]